MIASLDRSTNEVRPSTRWEPLRHGRVLVTLLVLGIVVVIGAAVALVRPGDETARVSRAFSVGSVVVTPAQLHDRMTVVEAMYGVRAPKKARQDRFRRDAAKSMAISLVMDQEAAAQGIKVSKRTARAKLSAFIDSALSGDQSKFVEFLASHRLSEAAVLEEIRRTIAVGELYQKVAGGVPEPTVAEALARYEASPTTFRREASRDIQNIVVSTRADALLVLRRIRAGEPFVRAARSASLDKKTRNRGGALGEVTRAELDPTYARAAFSAPTGSLFGPVKSQFGWNVGRVAHVLPARQLRFNEVRSALIAELYGKRREQAWVAWVNQKIQAAHISYAPSYRPAQPGIDAGVPQQP